MSILNKSGSPTIQVHVMMCNKSRGEASGAPWTWRYRPVDDMRWEIIGYARCSYGQMKIMGGRLQETSTHGHVAPRFCSWHSRSYWRTWHWFLSRRVGCRVHTCRDGTRLISMFTMFYTSPLCGGYFRGSCPASVRWGSGRVSDAFHR